MTHPHPTFREHLIELAERGHEPEFVPVDLPPLVTFDQLFATVDWYSLDVNQHLDDDASSRVSRLTTETVRHRGDAPPIKALVSEKLFALIEVFGAENVGMMTGDVTVNGSAPIICCTAEILANLALRQGADMTRAWW